MGSRPLLRARLRLALAWGFVIWTFIAELHFNVVRPYLLRGRELVGRSGPSRAVVGAYDAAMEGAELIGMGSTWRMYSPVPRHLRETTWEARRADGRWVHVMAPGVSPSRRRVRSLADALLWDFKRARVNDNYFIRRYLPALPEHYVLASREAIAAELGEAPQALRVRVYRMPIPKPADKGDWNPADAPLEKVNWERVFQ